MSSSPPPSPGRSIHFAELFLRSTDTAAPPPIPTGGAAGRWRSLDENAVTVLAVLLCGTVCALAVNSAVRCLLRRSRQRCGGVADGLPVLAFSPGMKIVGAGAAECAICLTEFAEGDRVRVLAPCNHGFHAKCVDRWVARQSSCPYCRGCLAGGGHRRDPRQLSLVSGEGADAPTRRGPEL